MNDARFVEAIKWVKSLPPDNPKASAGFVAIDLAFIAAQRNASADANGDAHPSAIGGANPVTAEQRATVAEAVKAIDPKLSIDEQIKAAAAIGSKAGAVLAVKDETQAASKVAQLVDTALAAVAAPAEAVAVAQEPSK